MLPSIAMEPQEELKQLLDRQESLQQELKARKKELLQAQRRQRDNLKRQILRAQSRVSSAERKRRTRRLILMGSYLEHLTGDDPARRDSLRKGLDGFLERDRDRELFDLPPVPIRAPKPCRWGFRLLPCGFPGRVLGSLNRMFSLFGLVLFGGRFIHRSAVHTTCSLLITWFFNYMYV